MAKSFGCLGKDPIVMLMAVSYTHLRAHETVLDLVCRLLLEKKNALFKICVYMTPTISDKLNTYIH